MTSVDSSADKRYVFTNLKMKRIIFSSTFKTIIIFDSFYVSMLSEKIKTGNTNFIKALRIGLKSNLNAKSTGEYSSLIYIAKKQ